MNLIEAMADRHLFASWFRDPSTWAAWRAFLAALFGLPMTEDQAVAYRQYTARSTLPTRPASEAWLVCGRRAGKSFILALCAVFLAAFYDYRQFLAPGEVGTILIIATDRRQARNIFRFIRGLLTGVPMLRRMIRRETSEVFELNNDVVIEVGTASFRSVRGYTIVAALCDEIARWPTDDAAEPDYEILNALRPGMVTIPNAMLLCASSPWGRRGAMWDAYRKHFGKDGSILIWQAGTLAMNPTVPKHTVDEALEHDQTWAAAEYLAEFRSDLEGFVGLEVVEACVGDYREMPPAAGTWYRAFVDPSGGSDHPMTLAISHKHGEDIIIDAIRERAPPFSPAAVVDEFVEVLKNYRISKVVGDHYGGEFVKEPFRKHAIAYEVSKQVKSDLFRDLLPLLNSGRIRLPRHHRLVAQIVGLERRVSRGGKDSIGPPSHGHDDVANAVAGAAAAARRGTYDLSAFGGTHLNDLWHAQQYWSRVLPPGCW
jgi:hypothetical protein